MAQVHPVHLISIFIWLGSRACVSPESRRVCARHGQTPIPCTDLATELKTASLQVAYLTWNWLLVLPLPRFVISAGLSQTPGDGLTLPVDGLERRHSRKAWHFAPQRKPLGEPSLLWEALFHAQQHVVGHRCPLGLLAKEVFKLS